MKKLLPFLLSLNLSLVAFSSLSGSLSAFGGIDKADTYSKNSDLQWEWALASIKKYQWKGNERVLDVGCGDGKITAQISRVVPKGMVVGLDVSPKMLSLASSNFSSNKYSNLLFLQGDASLLPFQNQYDLVVSFCALHWVLDQKAALLSIKDSLVKGGKALLVIPATSSNNLSTQVERLVLTDKWKSHFPSFKPQRIYFNEFEYKKLLIDVGLKPLSIEKSLSEITYQNQKALINWLKPLVTFTNHLTEELQVEFLNDLVKQMLEVDPPSSDGKIKIHHLKLEVLAQKT